MEREIDNVSLSMLTQLRAHVISEYKKLSNEPIAIISERDVGLMLRTIVLSIDEIVGPFVKFS
jgi:hypothetical protein